MNQDHKLILIPTPLEESLPLEPTAREKLLQAFLDGNAIFLVEDHKVARQRWLKWGLPREAIDSFQLYNEHNQEKAAPEIAKQIQAGKDAYLISDGGLPAFCDPGQELVRLCHQSRIRVTSTPFPNSISLAIALSGLEHRKFLFSGFLSTNPEERKNELEEIARAGITSVILDTPYRLSSLLGDMARSRLKNRTFFLATNLGSMNEKCYFGHFEGLKNFSESLHKPEFVMIVSGS